MKSNILGAIGSWLTAAGTLSPAVCKTLADCLKEKDMLKTGALTATLQVRFALSSCQLPSGWIMSCEANHQDNVSVT